VWRHFEVVNKRGSSGIWICDFLYETCVFSVIIGDSSAECLEKCRNIGKCSTL